jgi:hypothetical protein
MKKEPVLADKVKSARLISCGGGFGRLAIHKVITNVTHRANGNVCIIFGLGQAILLTLAADHRAVEITVPLQSPPDYAGAPYIRGCCEKIQLAERGEVVVLP